MQASSTKSQLPWFHPFTSRNGTRSHLASPEIGSKESYILQYVCIEPARTNVLKARMQEYVRTCDSCEKACIQTEMQNDTEQTLGSLSKSGSQPSFSESPEVAITRSDAYVRTRDELGVRRQLPRLATDGWKGGSRRRAIWMSLWTYHLSDSMPF
jgi:hypothetical protein